MKRIFPLSLLVASVAWVYACSDDGVEEPATPELDAGSETDSGGNNTPPDGGPGPTPDGAPPDAPVVFQGNPIEGASAPKAITPNDFDDFADGPLWRDGKLFFTLPGSFYVIEFTPPSTFTQRRDYTALNPAVSPIGQTFDTKTSTIITAESENAQTPMNRLVRWTVDGGAPTPINLQFDAGAGPNPWNSPNDVVARADGTLYVTDPGYQRAGAGAGDNVNRIYRISPTGAVFEEKVYPLNPLPNGVALSPDGSTLYVSFTQANKVSKFPVAANGTLGEEAAFVAQTPATPDGLNVDSSGNVYIATSTGVEVHKPDGTRWGGIPTPNAATGIAFGGADLKTLYITANGAVYEVTGLKAAGTLQ